jgi:hypothetical protein
MGFVVRGCYPESLYAFSLLLRLLCWGVSAASTQGVPLCRDRRYSLCYTLRGLFEHDPSRFRLRFSGFSLPHVPTFVQEKSEIALADREYQHAHRPPS